jgi:glucose-1-phosphate cytidylyltransferase
MKVVILAGGKGTRLGVHTGGLIPKPLVTIGGIPMLLHIMSIYVDQGMRDFVVAAGYKADILQAYASRARRGTQRRVQCTVADTGSETGTAGRLQRLGTVLRQTGTFLMTYGDGLADVNLRALLDQHRRMRERRGVLVTLTAAHPPARFGAIVIQDGLCTEFGEKRQDPSTWINAGFFVMEPQVLDLVHSDSLSLEYDILPILAYQDRLGVYQHAGYFQMMDTPRDLAALEEAWKHQPPPWATWRRKNNVPNRGGANPFSSQEPLDSSGTRSSGVSPRMGLASPLSIGTGTTPVCPSSPRIPAPL